MINYRLEQEHKKQMEMEKQFEKQRHLEMEREEQRKKAMEQREVRNMTEKSSSSVADSTLTSAGDQLLTDFFHFDKIRMVFIEAADHI